MEQPGWGRWGTAAPGPAGAGPEGGAGAGSGVAGVDGRSRETARAF